MKLVSLEEYRYLDLLKWFVQRWRWFSWRWSWFSWRRREGAGEVGREIELVKSKE